MQIIDTTNALKELTQDLRQNEYVTIDTEFIWESTFWAQLCLIQIAGRGVQAIIDPLASNIDLAPFYELLVDDSIVKVMHGCRNDVDIFFKQGGVIPNPLFDTQIAGMVCGFGTAVSYENLIRRTADIEIDKSQRNTNWSKRPLTNAQLDYAIGDVTHLRTAYEHIIDRLYEQNRYHWIEDEMRNLTNPAQYHYHPENAWKRFKINNPKKITLGVLVSIAAWREEKAQSRDVPRGRIIKDDAIREIATHPPKTLEDLARVRALPRNFINSYFAPALLKAVKNGLDLPPEKLPKISKTQPHATQGGDAYVALLTILLKHCAETADVASNVIANRDDLIAIIRGDNPDIPALHGWRYEIFGRYALAIKQGTLGLSAGAQGIKLIELDG